MGGQEGGGLEGGERQQDAVGDAFGAFGATPCQAGISALRAWNPWRRRGTGRLRAAELTLVGWRAAVAVCLVQDLPS